jgi:hypothetical protein
MLLFLFEMDSKKCSVCQEVKPLSDFYLSKVRTKKSGRPIYFAYCKSCKQKKGFKYTQMGDISPFTPLPDEIWLDVVGYEGLYKVSNLGRILSVKTRDKIMISSNTKGYRRIGLHKNGENTMHFVHTLVGMAFIPNPENKPTVNHKWGIKDDNRASELEWATDEEQMQHAYKLGLQKPKRAELCPTSKLTNAQAIEICNSHKSDTELSKIYNVARKTINHVRLGKTYGSVTGRVYARKTNPK